MKVIDLYVRLANNKEIPNKIKYNKRIFEYNQNEKRYYDIKGKFLDLSNIFGDYNFNYLDDEIEIIEEKPKKIEKFETTYSMNMVEMLMQDKINELQKAVNYLLEKESDK